eukprot:4945131-Amphidinium_carterae.1
MLRALSKQTADCAADSNLTTAILKSEVVADPFHNSCNCCCGAQEERGVEEASELVSAFVQRACHHCRPIAPLEADIRHSH